MSIGFIGLGKMGGRMVGKLIKDSHDVSVWNRTLETSFNLQKEIKTLSVFKTIQDLINQLPSPKIIWLMIPHAAVDEVLSEVQKYVSKGDVVIDGGNSHYKDTDKRFKEFEKMGIRYLGVGVSGGVHAADNGYPLMVGGDVSAYQYVTTILDSLSKPSGGHEYFGKGGAGHFVKMVHNGIEYPIMQSLGEGFGVLANSPYNFDLLKVAKLYQRGTLVSGFMLDRTVEALSNDPKLSHIAGVIGSASPEAIWTVEEAKKLKQPVESIEQAISFRKRSETERQVQNSFAAKLVGALRIAFGGHSVKKK